ncbi:MAG: type II toxin-antitoxin system prevent-host-death family antitoxin [Acidobacteria bacterium]|nr:type II toxin-antitoxin system prevent-host-death family antitoxin [Acidobacteriota bacterium]
MGQVSIRQLQQNLREIVGRVERGETVEVTRRHRPVARLIRSTGGPAPKPWPDVEARARTIFGDRVIIPSPSRRLIEDRGER